MAKTGPKIGSTHSGMFKKGYDPNRHVGSPWGKEKQSFQAKCQAYTEDALATLAEAINSPKVGWKDKLAATDLLLAHGHGKPVDRVQIAQLDGSGSTGPSLDIEMLRRKVSTLLEDPPVPLEVEDGEES
jgi:hypothetical protein